MLISDLSFAQRGFLLLFQLISVTIMLYALLWSVHLKMNKTFIAAVAAVFLVNLMLLEIKQGEVWYHNREIPLPPVLQFYWESPLGLNVWISFVMLVTALLILYLMIRWRRSHISGISIKEALDTLPTGLCFAAEDGAVLFLNPKMRYLASELTGHAIMDANAFWETIVAKSAAQFGVEKKRPTIELTNGTVWEFSRKQQLVDGRELWRIQAQDVTELSFQRQQLEEETKALSRMNERLAEYGRQVTESTRELEILEAKIRIHDDVGHALLATKRSLLTQVTKEEKENVLALWRKNLVFLRGEMPGEAEPKQITMDESLRDLTTAAEAIGVKIIWLGDRLPEDAKVLDLTETMLHECLTNTVRHAGGSEIRVSTMESSQFWILECSNNGTEPTGPIREGGGLSSLRQKVEREGGMMEILWQGGFLLRMSIPKHQPKEE